MDAADQNGWSAVAAEWAELWGSFADPARQAVLVEARVGSGSRVLDVGCGSGEFLAMAHALGAVPFGVDPAPGMVSLAHASVPSADIRLRGAEHLPWPDAFFDVVTAFNALQFADDPVIALAEMSRVTAVGGCVAVANWAEGALNDLNVLEAAVAAADDEELLPDGPLRPAGGLETLMRDAGLQVISSGLVEVPWKAPDDETLVRGVLLGEDAAGLAVRGPVVVEAAQPFRVDGGGYILRNAFRWVVARV
ncbi:MAG: SAM-dependent methyltransferase [Rhodoglobus sp.]|nr:SAM-dependent methyltransferase [Rhodoglobus sp.]